MKNDVISPEFDENGRPLRRIRSFVRRQGRLTKGQEHALENYWPVMGVEFSEDMLDFPALFGREAPVTLEIGFGMGASLVAMAKDRPEQDFLGIEVHSPGVGACLSSAHEEGLSNLRVMCHGSGKKSCTMRNELSGIILCSSFSLTRGTKRAIINAVSFRCRLPSW